MIVAPFIYGRVDVKKATYSKSILQRQIFLGIAWFIPFLAAAQIQPYHVRDYSEIDGLPSPWVHCSVQDRDGTMWFGTRKGLARFNGQEWTMKDDMEDIFRDPIIFLEKDEEGEIWAVSQRGSLHFFKLNDDGNQALPQIPAKLSNKSDIADFHIQNGKEGIRAWLATRHGELYVFRDGTWTSVELGTNSPIIYGIEVFEGQTLLATNAGLFIQQDSPLALIPYSNHKLPGTIVRGITVEKKKQKLWLHGGSWIGYIDKYGFNKVLEKEISTTTGAQILHLAVDNRGGVISSNQFATFYASQDPLGRWREHTLFRFGSEHIFEDAEHTLWMSTNRGVKTLLFNHFSTLKGLLEREVSCIAEVEPGSYLFGHTDGLSLLDEKGVFHIPFDPNRKGLKVESRVLDMAVEEPGTVWIAATSMGLGRWKRGQPIEWFGENDGLSLPVISVQMTPDGDLLVKSEMGPVMRWKNNRLETFLQTPNEVGTRRMIVLEDGTLFICTQLFGLYVYDGTKWSHFQHPSRQHANSIYDVMNHPAYGLLVGTRRGLYKAEDATLVPVLEDAVGGGRPVYALHPNADGSFWIGTDFGYYLVAENQVTHFGIEAGLTGLEANRSAIITDSFGRLFLGTDGGAALYNPEYLHILKTLPEPKIAIELKSDTPQGEGTQIRESQSGTLLFSFQAQSYYNPEHLNYRTRLLGLETDWAPAVNAQMNEVRYIQLPPGTYQLEVQAALPHRDWTASAYSAPILIPKALWQETWFRLLSAFICLAIVFLVMMYLFRIRYTKILEREISETSRRLEHTESAYSQLFNNSPIGIYRTSRDGKVLASNPALNKMLGIQSSEDMEQYNLKEVAKYYAKNDRDEFVNELESKGSLSGRISTWIRNDGSFIHIRENAKLIRDEKGVPLYYEGTVEDISESLRITKELEVEKDRLWVTLASLTDSVITTDGMGRVLLMNPAAEKLLGLKRAASINHIVSRILDLRYPNQEQLTVDIARMVLSEEVEALQGEYLLVPNTVTQEPIRVRVACTPIKFQDGRVHGCVVVLTDISLEKQLEVNRIKSQKLESLSHLAGGIAHDFNNMLTSILGNIQLAKIQDEPNKVRERLDASERAIIRAQSLTKQLLTFSKGGAPVKELVDLKPIVFDTVSFSSSGTSTKLLTHSERSAFPVYCDPGQITQVVSNLTLNALQAMEQKGTLRVHLETGRPSGHHPFLEADDDYVLIRFQDTGHGIPKEDLSKIFDPYFTTKKFGSGLGLASTYSIIRQHDGHIEVQSQLGIGTTFSIYLPLTKDEPPESVSNPSEIRGGRILLLDDDEMVLEVGTQILGALGYQAEGSKSGEEAIQRFKESQLQGVPFDLVLLDLTIPGGMGGRETMQHLLQLDPQLKGIVSSGYSNDDVMSHPEKYGFVAVLPKPYTLENLKSTLAAVNMDRKGHNLEPPLAGSTVNFPQKS